MKKILLFALPLLAMIAVSCEKGNGAEPELSGDDIIEFKDPNFLKALLTVQELEVYDEETGNYISYTIVADADNDGKISVNEAKRVKAIVLEDERGKSLNVKEMPEIKYFTAVTVLYCRENQLTALDLSKNTALTMFVCGPSQLTSLDLSKNTALTVLGCPGNALTVLDLSKNTALRTLYCSENYLKKVILPANHSVESECIESIIEEYGNIIEYR